MATQTEQVAHADLVGAGETALHSHAGGAAIPAGVICMWHGLLSNIPTGWVLCNGSSGTPDLREKFVKGAVAGQNPGATGGAATHTHAQHPALSHSGTAVGDHSNVNVPATATAAVKIGTAGATGAANSHTHTITTIAHSVTQPGAHAAQDHDTPNSEPAYYAIAYIMKT